MTKSTITRERLAKIKSWRETYGAGSNVMLPAEEAEELACLALATMDSEPVAYADPQAFENFEAGNARREWMWKNPGADLVALYRHAQPAPEYPETLPCPVLLEPGLRFGKGIKTSTMLAALSRRAVHESDMAALSPEERAEFRAGIEGVKALIAQPAPVAQCPYPCGWDTLNKLAIQDAAFVSLALVAGEPATESIRRAVISNNDRLLKVISFCRDVMPQAGNSPVIGIDPASGPDYSVEVRYVAPPGYVMVPKDLLSELRDWAHPEIEKYCEMREGRRDSEFTALRKVIADADALLTASPQPQNAPQNIPEIIPGWIPVSERMPEPGILVLVYTPPQPDDYPGDVRIGFDYIDPDGDDPTYWFNHAENYEHFYCVACDGMTGPSEKAPYTHWIPLPAAPQEVKGE
ncbi:DUF551 domain-containing protein [Klebsiella pneumoniae]